ncbi:MAG: sugar ABC transporter substrate-binding protein [Prosthecobacter sp.]|nr:sugar ABC transporter substrate-binding protein [Prosthecobacter sp.]
MKFCRRFWLVSLILGLGLVSCERRSRTQTPVVESRQVFLLISHGSHSFELGQQSLLTRLVATDPRYQLQVLDAGSNEETQLQQWRQAVAEKPLAILIDPLNPKRLSSQVNGAVSSGVLVIGLGEEAQKMECSTVLFANQKKMGELAGDMVVQALTKKASSSGLTEVTGRVVEIRGDEESYVSLQRHEGFEAALKAVPGIILVHDAPGDWSLEGGKGRAMDALRLQQTFDAVYAHNDLMALGAAEALVDHRADVLIVGTDGFRGKEGGMTLVGDGEIDATLYQPLLVDFAWVLIRKKVEEPAFNPKPSYELPLRTIQPKDVDEIRRKGLPAFPEL